MKTAENAIQPPTQAARSLQAVIPFPVPIALDTVRPGREIRGIWRPTRARGDVERGFLPVHVHRRGRSLEILGWGNWRTDFPRF